MFRFFTWLTMCLALAGANSAMGFAMLGPLGSASWQTDTLGYNASGVDIGGPRNIGEEYRWNMRTITYGFDKHFLDYFGQRGVVEVNKAVAILNRLPQFSRMSATLTEFPLDTRQVNYQAAALNLLDLKSSTLGALVEEIGLASPERYVWTLQSRTEILDTTNYWVIMRNFDPITLRPTPYVNGFLYTYDIIEFMNPQYTDAVESLVDPLAQGFNAVASTWDSDNAPPTLYFGTYFTGLTRDDVGGLRYIYQPQNMNVEDPHPGTIPVGPIFSPWGQIPGTGSNIVTTAVRPGINKLYFRRVPYYGIFLPTTNRYVDLYLNSTNLSMVSQRFERVLTQPDILFTAGILGNNVDGSPALIARTVTDGWADNSVLNNPGSGGQGIISGPGVIQAPIAITFSTVGPVLLNVNPGLIPSQADTAFYFGGWAAFDGTTNAPFVFPRGESIRALEQLIFLRGL